MVFRIADDLHAAPAFDDRIALRDGVRSVVCSFGLNVGANLPDQGADIQLRKDDHCIDRGQRSDNLGALAFRNDWTSVSFESAHRGIGIDRNDQFAPECLGCSQIADVSDVQEIERAVCQDDALATTAPLVDSKQEFIAREDFIVLVQCAIGTASPFHVQKKI